MNPPIEYPNQSDIEQMLDENKKLKTNWSDLREEILHDSELDNDTINHVLGVIDSYDA